MRLEFFKAFCMIRMARILNTINEIKNLDAPDKHKLFDYLTSYNFKEHHCEKLYQIDTEIGYDLNDVKCIELALATMYRK